MNERKGFFFGTLIAITIGGLVATLLMTIIGESVKSQRAILDRDEASEFTRYVRGILLTDSMCTKFLRGLPLKNDSLVLKDAGYREQTRANLGQGFRFAGDSLKIQEFSYQNITENPVRLRVTIDSNTRFLRRYLLRVKLNVTSVDGITYYRPRYFEIPVFVGDEGKIEACNNDVSPADACQSMGFRWVSGSTPSTCVPDTACVFGGSYVLNSAGGCKGPHAVTETCQCPRGFKPLQSGAINVNLNATICKKGCDEHVLRHDTVVQCYKCPF